MRKPLYWFVLELLLTTLVLTGLPAAAATVQERRVEITLRPDGQVREHHRLRVRIDNPMDRDAWATHWIPLDENRTLERLEAYVQQPDGGERKKVGRKQRDTVETSGGGIFHSSLRFEQLDFAGLQPGALLVLDYEVAVAPYFPAANLSLRYGDDAISELVVTITGGGLGWRWHLDGPAEGLQIEESAGGLVVRARDLPALDLPPQSPDGAAVRPVLRYAWGSGESWADVGRWYRQLAADLPRGTPEIRAKARQLTAGLTDPRAQLEALLTFTRRDTRYVAVELGIGGFRPAAPAETLSRQWGDCKGKALLLIDLLREIGVEAYPTLALLSTSQRVDRAFPSPFQFNHLIVAVPVAEMPPGADDPVGGGYVFLDPTQTRGAARWLHPGVQEQDVLVVLDDGAELVEIAGRPHLERRTLVVELAVAAEGASAGKAGMRLTGWNAMAFVQRIASEAPERVEEDVRGLFSALLPGVTLEQVSWKEGEDAGVPAVDLRATLAVGGLLQGAAEGRPALQLPYAPELPETRLVDGRTLPLLVEPGVVEVRWQVDLGASGLGSAWCLPEAGVTAGNALGKFEQTVAGDPAAGRLTVERRVEVNQRWIEPAELPQLHELALAEHRNARRRLRLACG